MDFSRLIKGQYFTYDQTETALEMALKGQITKAKRGVCRYYNTPCSFDIETTSFYNDQQEKTAIMYGWVLGLNGAVILGRTWEQFLDCIDRVKRMLEVTLSKRLIIYVHNLAYEFQFIRHLFQWEKVFALRERKPIYALTTGGIEFRCSYLLSGYSLAEVGKHLMKYKVEKMVGDLDYSKMRHSRTPLTDKEIGYMVNDAKVVMSYIMEKIETDGNITKIPLTKTGYVRIYCRKKCLYYGDGDKRDKNKYFRYRDLMNSMVLEPDEYSQLKRAFQGGFTHASAWKSGKIMRDVSSFDFTSSYPAVMLSEKFPMETAEYITITSKQQFRDSLMAYCCLFDVEFKGLQEKEIYEHPLSLSRCKRAVNVVDDNGRVVSADYIVTTLTEQDFIIMEKFYTWDKMGVANFRRYKRGYLPKDFVTAILDLYQAKTELKGVKGKEIEYARAKEMINSCYGMTVTDICRPEIGYKDSWVEDELNIEQAIAKYNEARNRFLFYPWGVWVTAYARKNLFTGIYEFKTDYVYSDTDSIKAINADRHIRYIEGYNKHITEALKRAMDYHGIDSARTAPLTKDGIQKPLGVWDAEGQAQLFKSLGAKRYMTYKDGKLSITVSGLNKTYAVPYILEQAGGDINRAFELFSDELYIPPGKTGKNTHTYIDEERQGLLTDYTGLIGEYHEHSAVHMEEADYSLSLSTAYANFLKGLTTYFD